MKRIRKSILTTIIASMLLITTVPSVPNEVSCYTVEAATTTVKLSETKIFLTKGKSFKLKLNGTDEEVTWTSSNTKIATVNPNGKVTAKKKGTAIITAKVEDNEYKCKVVVENPKINKKSLSFYVKGSRVLKISGTKQKVKWKSSNKSVAVVSPSGIVTAKKAGKCTITATVGGKKYSCKITIKSKKNPNTQQQTGQQTGDSSGTVYWVSSGSVYHSTPDCPTLSRSHNILSGSVASSGKSRPCKVCH